MALVNVTCAMCAAGKQCAQCGPIAKTLREAGHAVTESSRYDALRAAMAGSYGFDACVLAASSHEDAVVYAASTLLTRPRVALIVDRGSRVPSSTLPKNFTLIEAADWNREPFPLSWIEGPLASPLTLEETQSFELPDAHMPGIELARRRLRGIANVALRGIGAAGFPDDARLDVLATLEDEIAWAKMSASHFGIVLLHVPRHEEGQGGDPESLDHALSMLAQHVNAVTRKSDVIARSADSLLVVLPDAGLDETDLARQRIKKAARKALQELTRDVAGTRNDSRVQVPSIITLGSAVYPTHGMARATLLARATASASKL